VLLANPAFCKNHRREGSPICITGGRRAKASGLHAFPSFHQGFRAEIYFLSGTIYWTTNVTICVIAPAAAGVHVFACGTNCTIRMVMALAKIPALTFAVGAQLVGLEAVCVGCCESVVAAVAMEDLLEVSSL
jgi:hypothetical protein